MQIANNIPRRMTEQQARQFIKEQHNYYYGRLDEFLRKLELKRPELPTYQSVDCVFRHCGQYNPRKHEVQYSIPYCVYLGEEYAETIAHEMSHAFQRSVKRDDPAHGTTFLWLLAECGIDVSDKRKAIYHTYPVLTIDRLAEQLKEERGGSDHITMQPVRRKTLKELVAERNKQR